MPTKTKVKRRGPPRLRGTMSDASKLRNPNARPRRISSRPTIRESSPIRVVDRTAERLEPSLLILTAEPMACGNKFGKHSIVYRCHYSSDRADRELHERDVFARTGAEALEKLCDRMEGFDVTTLEIFGVRPPLTGDQVAAIGQMNEDLRVERVRMGIYGEGDSRTKMIEHWLRK